MHGAKNTPSLIEPLLDNDEIVVVATWMVARPFEEDGALESDLVSSVEFRRNGCTRSRTR